MAIHPNTPWHRQSYDSFMAERLPRLLAGRLPLSGYSVEPAGPYACTVRVSVAAGGADVQVAYENVPQPDGDGVFSLAGRQYVVVPTASGEDLAGAQVRCVGDYLQELFDARLGKAPGDLPWDQALLRAVLPLDEWIAQFVAGQRWQDATDVPPPMAQELDAQNWLARWAHLRRVAIPGRKDVIHPSQFGRTCPFETPEGANIGLVMTLAVGASIRDGRIVVDDESPPAALGLTASMVPFVEHNDSNHQLMGVNMMRQAVVPDQPEPALVQTGNEPDESGFWCGRNLLTAYVSWGPGTFEDAMVVSESAASRLGFAGPLQVGDKLSNRHGAKGTVSQILPDDRMPHLADGTPADVIYNFIGLAARLNYGQVREALEGRLARAAGKASIVPPFAAPSPDDQRRRLRSAGLDESGMEVLTDGRGGARLDRPSTVGYVYWYKLRHLSIEKLVASVGPQHCMIQGQMEYFAMRDVGALGLIGETYGLRSVDHPDAAGLADRVAAGEAIAANEPSPKLTALTARLGAGGIAATLSGDKLTFAFADPPDPIRLAHPIPHPWLPRRELSTVGRLSGQPGLAEVEQANARLARLMASGAPAALHQSGREQLAAKVGEYLDGLFNRDRDRDVLRLWTRVQFSAKAVLSPAMGLTLEQVGVSDQIAWTLFGPLLRREGVSSAQVEARSDEAALKLDALMARTWVVLNRAPTMTPTALLAFHPVRIPDRVIRLHPLACCLVNGDFDGDQAGLFLPITEAGQRDAGERLSVAGHLRRDPGLVKWIAPKQEMIWGLARLSLSDAGRRRVADVLGFEPALPQGLLTREVVDHAMRRILDERGVEAVMSACQRLMELGFEAAKASGASMSPFLADAMDLSDAPDGDDSGAWDRFSQRVRDRIESLADFDHPVLGPQVLAVRSGARSSIAQMLPLLGSRGTVSLPQRPGPGEAWPRATIRHGLAAGLSVREMLDCTMGARVGLSNAHAGMEAALAAYGIQQPHLTTGFGVLKRAMRSPSPGLVFAGAAATGETDPLSDLDSRLLLGLAP